MIHSEFRNVIVCEDVREEIGNKKSLMGLLSGDILVPQFPAQIKLAFYIEYLPPKDVVAERDLEFIIVLGDNSPISGKVRIGPVQDVANIVIPSALAKFKEPGDIILYVRLGDDMRELTRKPVRLPNANETLSLTPHSASPQPS
jgi:hypothetical protein